MELHGWSIVLAGVENFFLANTALSLGAFSAACLLRAYGQARAWHPLRRARVYTLALVVPPLVSSWLVCAALLPALWLDEIRWRRAHSPAHSLHLLNAFTIPLDPLLGYAALIFTLIAAFVAVYAAVRIYFRIGGVIEQLEIGAEPATPEKLNLVEETCRKYGIAVGLVVSNYPFTFIWGYLRSKLVVSTGLLNALTTAELANVLEHEVAHHTRRDNVTRLALTVCRYLSPVFPLTGLLYRWWGEQVEMICDEVSARRTQAPVELAGALVRLKRLTLAVSNSFEPVGIGFFGSGRDDFERRVNRVLALTEERLLSENGSLARSCVRLGALTLAAFALSLGALFALSPLAVHEAIEIVLRNV
jgi:Zn-dependent protease with chaperone function